MNWQCQVLVVLLRRCCGMLMLLVALCGLPAGLLACRQVWLDVDLGAAVVEPMTLPVLVLAVVVAGWLLWAWLVVATVLDAATVLTRRTGHVRLLPAPLQTTVTSLAGSLLVATTSLTAAASASAGGPPPGAATDASGPLAAALPAPAVDAATAVPDVLTGLVQVSSQQSTVQAQPVTEMAGAVSSDTPAQSMTVTVRRGDTLWSISARCLGDPHRWREIYRLNTARYDRAGRMHGGDHIEPGWVLQLPADMTAGSGADTNGATTDAGDAAGAPPGMHTPPGATPATASGQTTDDGVTDPHSSDTPPRTSGPEAPVTDIDGPGKSGQTGGPGEAGRAGRPEPGTSGVRLFSGSWVDAGLVVAITTAAALVWAHRRRRYVPAAPTTAARLDDADFPAMPPIVQTLRRGARTRVPPPTGAVDTDQHAHRSDVADSSDEPAERINNDAADQATVDQRSDGSSTEDDSDTCPTPVGTPTLPGWRLPGGLGLTGPGAQAAARGLLITAMADGADEPAARSVVVIPTATATRLFGTGPGLPDTPRISVTSDLPQALDLLEALILHRSRVVHQHAVDTVAEVRHADPLEAPMPPMILLADAGGADQGRIAALLRQGHPLDVHGVLLGAWPDGVTVTVAADGTTTPTDNGVHRFPAVGRMTVLTAGEAADLLNVLAEAHTGQPPSRTDPQHGQPSPIAEDVPNLEDALNLTDAAVANPAHNSAGHHTSAAANASPAPSGENSPSTDDGGTPATADSPQPDDAARADTGNEPRGKAGTSARRVLVRLLGTPQVVNADTSSGSLRAKSLELLAYLAVHDDAVHYEAILDDLLPDAPASKAVHRLHTYISNLRQVLRRTGGADTYLTRTGQRYQLNREAFDVDLWRMRAALRTAELADTVEERVTAWRAVLDAYQGHLAEGVDYEWVEPHREAARRQAIDAAVAIADALPGEPDTVLPILDAAIRHSPYTEALYQAAMRANATAGRLDAVRALRHDLTRQLADIDAEPSEETAALADRLLTTAPPRRPSHPRRPAQPRHQPGRPNRSPLPGPRPGHEPGHEPSHEPGHEPSHEPSHADVPTTGDTSRQTPAHAAQAGVGDPGQQPAAVNGPGTGRAA
ncbi:BTAD domain-containing putative transcriptional regulator [Dactylosporangium sp. NPDC050688]|uniref:BTAD domain-containing putative transcriptional regulator n=1 Tax=Dactylosporangium sp. NPDC050688 TaxID=3157217 RepID=UPI0033DA60DA